MTQQTAMQQLIQWMEEKSLAVPFDQGDCWNKAEELLQTEKEQHHNTWIESGMQNKDDLYIGKQVMFHEYYKETYGK